MSILRISIFLLVAGLLPVILGAQAVDSVNCSGMNSRGCQSFRELIAAHNEEILNSLKESNHQIYVCFRPNEDAFTLVEVQQPNEALWKPGDDGLLEQWDLLETVRYKNRVSDGWFSVDFYWTKREGESDASATGSSDNDATSVEDKAQASVNGKEIIFSYTNKDKNGTATDYKMQINKTTVRFLESIASVAGKREISGRCLCLQGCGSATKHE